jgi:uncharacterized protein (TIGR03086 family)
MTETADRYRRLAAAMTGKIENVAPDQWSNATPCEDWTARDLVAHLVTTHGMIAGLVGLDLVPVADPQEDPLAAWTSVRDRMQAYLDDPQAADREYEGKFGRSTLSKAVDGFICFDLVVHGWDLARATGQDEHIDSAELDRARREIEARGDAARAPGVLGPELAPAPGADEQARLLAFLGRRA